MALMTLAEVKTFLRITDATLDTLITTYIPLIEEDITDYLQNWFADKAIFVKASGGLAFNRGNTASGTSAADNIVDDNDNFTSAGFTDLMDIVIAGGSNYGIYKISSVTTAVMKTQSTGIFVDQDQDTAKEPVGAILISRINWPSALKPIAAKMIWYQIDTAKQSGAKSERIDDYSVVFAGARAYPEQLLNQLNKWRYLRTQ